MYRDAVGDAAERRGVDGGDEFGAGGIGQTQDVDGGVLGIDHEELAGGGIIGHDFRRADGELRIAGFVDRLIASDQGQREIGGVGIGAGRQQDAGAVGCSAGCAVVCVGRARGGQETNRAFQVAAVCPSLGRHLAGFLVVVAEVCEAKQTL